MLLFNTFHHFNITELYLWVCVCIIFLEGENHSVLRRKKELLRSSVMLSFFWV